MILNQDFAPPPLERTKNENKKIQYIHACTWLELKKIFRKIELVSKVQFTCLIYTANLKHLTHLLPSGGKVYWAGLVS